MPSECIPLLGKPSLFTYLYHNILCKEIVLLVYNEDTVEVGYNQQVVVVDNTMYHDIHDNHWFKLTLHDIDNFIMVFTPLNAMFVGNPMFLSIGEKVQLIAGIVPIISISSSSAGDFFHVE